MRHEFITSGFLMPDERKQTPRQLIMKHILDPNHKITDEEFSQLEVGDKAHRHTMVGENSTNNKNTPARD